jgi:hypothetical protein
MMGELERQGRGGNLSDPVNAALPILARYKSLDNGARPSPIAAGELLKTLTGVFAVCAEEIAQVDPGLGRI